MRWFRWRERPNGGGAHARKAAQASLQDQIAQWPDVLEVSASLRKMRQHNHFAEQVEKVWKGKV